MILLIAIVLIVLIFGGGGYYGMGRGYYGGPVFGGIGVGGIILIVLLVWLLSGGV